MKTCDNKNINYAGSGVKERNSMSNLLRYRYKPDPTRAFYASIDGGAIS